MLPPNAPLACLSHGDLVRLVEARDVRIREMSARMEELGRRVAWFERQLFGSLSERRALQGADARQLFLNGNSWSDRAEQVVRELTEKKKNI